MEMLRFTVIGTPVPQGSKRAFVVGKGENKRAAVVDSSGNKLESWRWAVAFAAGQAAQEHGWEAFDGPLVVEVTFLLKRPASHYGKNGLKPSAPKWPFRKPDVDKLLRAIMDGLVDSNCIMTDDARVVRSIGEKRYAILGAPLGAVVRIWKATETLFF